MFETAGSADDLRTAYLDGQVTSRLQEADQLLLGAKAVMTRTRPSIQGRRKAELKARKALSLYASGLNWAEDSSHEEVAHARLDAAGRWVRQTFGCFLHQAENRYQQRCPVALGHNRVGFSVGGTAVPTCSLCGGDLSECEHLRGTAYLVPGGSAELGWCRVCLQKEGCEHQPDQRYRVGLVSMILQMDLDEVSVVSRPAHPDARITSIDIEIAELCSQLGPGFVPGMQVSCDRCLTPCGGLTRPNIKHTSPLS